MHKDHAKFLQSIFCWISICLFVGNLHAQAPQKNPGNSTADNMVTTMNHDTCVGKRFNVVFYLFQDTAMSITNNPATQFKFCIPDLIRELNLKFKPICVSFVNCSTVVVPYTGYNNCIVDVVIPNMIKTYYTEGAINIYYPETLTTQTHQMGAYSYVDYKNFPNDEKRNILVFEQGSMTKSLTPTTYTTDDLTPMFHSVGHFFGLPDTFEEINSQNPASPPPPTLTPSITSQEWATRVNGNCYVHGDGFCDTDADPFPAQHHHAKRKIESCFLYGLKDGKNEYYFPPIQNFMSLYRCRCSYSQEQYNFMAHFIIRKRLYLQ